MSKSVSIIAAPHTGITVRSLADALQLFHVTLSLPIVRNSTFGLPLVAVTGYPQATIHTSLLQLPGGHRLELLQYELPESEQPTQNSQWEKYLPSAAAAGSWHLCLEVDDIEQTLNSVKELGYKAAGEPQMIEQGDDAGTKVVYAPGPDGLLEFWEREKKRA